MSRHTLLIAIIFFAISGNGMLYGQPDVELNTYRNKYPGESAVLLKKVQSIDISIVNKNLSIQSEFYEEQFFLDSKASLFSEESIPYSGFYEVFDITGKTLVPQKRKYKSVPVEQVTEKDEFNTGIFYDDMKSKNFVYPFLQEGAKTTLFYKQKTKDPHFLRGFYLAELIPIEETELVIKSDKNIELAFSYQNTSPEECGFSRTETKDKIIYKWSNKDVDKLTLEPGSPSHLNFIPHIIPRIASYTVDNNKINVLSNTTDLHNWYFSLINKMENNSSNAELVGITDSITRGLENEVEKVKAIYNWVQNNIKYIAVEDGLGGFIPRDPVTVLENRYGDCKDMSNIIHNMLKIADIQSHITWVGTRDIPYSYDSVPTPSVDNHMIATYIHDGEYYFLDATGQYTPLGIPSSFIQGKEVMINYGESYNLVRVPEVPFETSQVIDSIVLTIQDGTIFGKAKSQYTGYQKIELTERVGRLDADKRMRFFRNNLNKGSNKFLLDNFELNNLENKYEPLTVDYTFNIADYVKSAGDEIYINMNLDRWFSNSIIKDSRVQGIEREYKTKISSYVELNVPEGYVIEYLPENNSYDHEAFTFSINYSKKDRKIILESSVVLNHLLLRPDQFKDWNEMVKQLNIGYSELVLLKTGL